MTKQLLIVEDHKDIARLVQINLDSDQLQVDHAEDGITGLSLAIKGRYDLVILDLMLPGLDGLDICRAMRQQNIFTPVLMLTARSTEQDRVLGLEAGADDYLVKPFSVAELIARVHAMLRRADQYRTDQGREQQQVLRFGDLVIDADRHTVTHGTNMIELTAREFDLLWCFASHPGRVYSRAQLLDRVWGYGHEGYEHTVNSHINRLRAKLERNPAQPDYVKTVWGVGYKFTETPVRSLNSALEA